MRLRRGLRHPLGLVLLAACCLIAAALLVVPNLAAWSSRAGWVFLVGLAAYLAVATVVALPPRRRWSLGLSELRKVRKSMAARLAALCEANGPSSPLVPVLADALARLDRELLPALTALTDRHETLGEQIDRYDAGQLPTPDPAVLARLRGIHERQTNAIATCVLQAANADAALVALVAEAGDARVAADAQRWADELQDVYEALTEVLRGEQNQ